MRGHVDGYSGDAHVRKFVKSSRMKTSLQIDLTFEQILALVKQLPKTDKIKLSLELEKEAINTKLTQLLKTFRTKELDLKTIDSEVEEVRKEMYAKRGH